MAALARETHSRVECLNESEKQHSIRVCLSSDASASMDRACERPFSGSGIDHGEELLRRTIEGEIIPRLMLTVGSPRVGNDDFGVKVAVTGGNVSELVRALLEGSLDDCETIVDALLDRGVSRPDVLLELFAPAARLLGEYWDSDACDFVDVTIAMGRLQQSVRRLDCLQNRPEVAHERVAKRILLVPAMGEQHIFALQVLDAFFSRAGWTVDREPTLDLRIVCAHLKRTHLDVIGLTVSREDLLEGLASDIQRMRRASWNRSMVVLVGGGAFSGHPEFVARVGADGMADDARSAVNLAERLMPVQLVR